MQARGQKSAMGGEADLPTTGGNWSLGARPPATGGIGCGGRVLQRSKLFLFFGKNNNFRPILIKIDAINTWHRN